MSAAGRVLCAHCGLPVRGARIGEGPWFCCSGCALAWRIVGEQDHSGAPAALLVRLGSAGVLAMTVMMVSLLLYYDAFRSIGPQAVHVFRWGLLVLSSPVLIILAPPYLLGCARELRSGRPSLDSLIALGSLAGFGVSAVHVVLGRGYLYFDTASMLLVLVTLGRLLEASARAGASSRVRSLLDLTPEVAYRLEEGEAHAVPSAALSVGDRVRVRPGQRLPADGVIRAGRSSVHEAALTGEFTPRAVGPEEAVYGGSVNGEGELTVEVTAAGESTRAARIAQLVAQAQERRAPLERLAEQVAVVFVPAVLVVAAGAFAYWLWRGSAATGGMSALAVLVVACPCALGLATPLAVSVALSRAARQAVLIRSGEALERLAQVSFIFFDKTGTLTVGKPVLGEIALRSSERDESEALSWLASLESASEHVIGRAVVEAAAARGVAVGRVSGFRAFPGEGARGDVERNGEAREVWAGTQELLERAGLKTALEWPDPAPAASLLYLAWGGSVRARVEFSDVPRPEARAVVCALEGLGLTVGILSGDRSSAVEEIAQSLGIRVVAAGLAPEGKVTAVRREQSRGRTVGVVGDGINDAPALAQADVGIAMGSGTDLAREVGHVVLLGEGLHRLPWLVSLARRTRRVIRQNLAWAFGYNLAAIAVAFFGKLHPLLAALLMLISSAVVLRNSLRLGREQALEVEEAPG